MRSVAVPQNLSFLLGPRFPGRAFELPLYVLRDLQIKFCFHWKPMKVFYYTGGFQPHRHWCPFF